MKIALAQIKLNQDMELNKIKALEVVIESANSNADLVCFPELQLSPFFPQYPSRDVSQYAMEINNPFMNSLQNLCAIHGLCAIPNFYLKENGFHYDASPMINADGSVLGISKMVHICQAAEFYEQDYYDPSDTGFHVYNTARAKVGIVICFDRHLPESIRTCALNGAEIIIIPTANTHAEPMELFEWEMRVAAMQNGVYIAMCNRVGIEDKMHFCGESIVIDPFGNVLTKANDEEQILYSEINLELVKTAQADKPFLKLRRPEYYE